MKTGRRTWRARCRQGVASSLALVAATLVACHASAPGSEDTAGGTAASQRTLVVFAASSLREAFTAIAIEHQRKRPKVKVTFNFAGTQELRAQIEQGAKADVFAAADPKHAEEIERQGLTRASKIFAENEPVLVVATDWGARITSFAQLAHAKRIVLGAPEVPIGRYSVQILDNATRTLGADFASKVQAKVVSKELNVKQVLAKIVLGEADAGIVYRTDTTGAAKDKVRVVAIPTEMNVAARYTVAAVPTSEHAADAEAWIDTVLSDAGRAILTDAGFEFPANMNSSL